MAEPGLVTSFLESFQRVSEMERERKRDRQMQVQQAVDNALRQHQQEIESERLRQTGEHQRILEQQGQERIGATERRITDLEKTTAERLKQSNEREVGRNERAYGSQWTGIYNKAVSEGRTHDEAVELATDAMRKNPATPDTKKPPMSTLGQADVIPKLFNSIAPKIAAGIAVANKTAELKGIQANSAQELASLTAAVKKAQAEHITAETMNIHFKQGLDLKKFGLQKRKQDWFEGPEFSLRKMNAYLRQKELEVRQRGLDLATTREARDAEKFLREYKDHAERPYQAAVSLRDKERVEYSKALAKKSELEAVKKANNGQLGPTQLKDYIAADAIVKTYNKAHWDYRDRQVKQAESERNQWDESLKKVQSLYSTPMTQRGTFQKTPAFRVPKPGQPGTKKLTVEQATEFLRRAGGDRSKAKDLAKQEGY